jgi:hypothetical protein
MHTYIDLYRKLIPRASESHKYEVDVYRNLLACICTRDIVPYHHYLNNLNKLVTSRSTLRAFNNYVIKVWAIVSPLVISLTVYPHPYRSKKLGRIHYICAYFNFLTKLDPISHLQIIHHLLVLRLFNTSSNSNIIF